MAGYVFISYARADIRKISPLLAALRNAGVELWLDESDILGGAQWESRIEQAILNARAFVVFLSQQSLRAESYVLRELQIADSQLLALPAGAHWMVPVKLDSVQVPDIRMGHKQLTAYNVIGPDIDRLVKSVLFCIAPGNGYSTLRLHAVGDVVGQLYVDGVKYGYGPIFHVPAGQRRLWHFYEYESVSGRVYTRIESNALTVSLPPNTTTELLVRKSERRGLFWLFTENGSQLVLEELRTGR